MKKIILLLFAFLFSLFLSGQVGWIKNINGQSELTNIISTPDGNYAFTVRSVDGLGSNGPGFYLIKIDPEGNTIWTNKISSETSQNRNATVYNTFDDGFFVDNSDFLNGPSQFNGTYFVKFNQDGVEEWSEDFPWYDPNDPINVPFQLSPTSDGGYFGITLDFRIKLDENFNLVWKLPHPPIGYWDILESSQGGYFISLRGSESIYKLDEDGIEEWEAVLPSSMNLKKVLELDTGELMAFNLKNPDTQKQVKLDSDGNLIWEKNIEISGYETIICDVVQVDDGFILSGMLQLNDGDSFRSVLLVKTDMEGNTVWERSFKYGPINSIEEATSLVATEENGVIGLVNIGTNQSAYLFSTDANGFVSPNQITGSIGKDEITDCILDSTETRLHNILVGIENTNFQSYTFTDSLGNYQLSVDTGNYILNAYPPSEVWDPCENDIAITVLQNATTTLDIPMQAIVECPVLNVNTSFPIARPCFDNNRLHVNYCNDGSITATDAYIEITVDDFISYVSSSIDLTSQTNNTYTFDLGDLTLNDCGNFYVDFMLGCDAPFGVTTCIETHIFPDASCFPAHPDWNGAFVEVSGACQDSIVQFYIENTGTADMTSPNQFTVIEDAILLLFGNFQLLQGQIDTISLPANGSSYRLIAEQVANASGNPFPTAWVEGCENTGNFSTGFVNQFSLGDNVPYMDIDCSPITGSYDPNDKQGFPMGYGNDHIIRPNTDIEYFIRFQNTGTDTAFRVVVKDEISPLLDIPSIRIGASSHPMEWKISDGNTIEFIFNNIMLPDSNINEVASHGFVEFKIAQQIDLPLETVIKNDAAIYFDFNAPIITNETFHTLSLEYITVSTQNPVSNAANVMIRPNPFQHQAIFELENIETTNGLFELFDISGRLAWQQKFSGKQFELKRNDLKSGMYFYKISDNGKIINSGKIIVN